jgi:hypothetical protein
VFDSLLRGIGAAYPTRRRAAAFRVVLWLIFARHAQDFLDRSFAREDFAQTVIAN